MTQTPPEIAKWLQEQLARIEAIGNEMLEAQVYTDGDDIPTAAAGTGTITIAAFYLSADLAAHSDQQLTDISGILARHAVHIENTMGSEAWPDVLLTAVMFLTMQHLEPALTLLDTTTTPLRTVEHDYWAALNQTAADNTTRPATEDAGDGGER